MLNADRWEVGSNGIVFTISRKIRTNENVSARFWLKASKYNSQQIKIINSFNKAQKICDKLNKFE